MSNPFDDETAKFLVLVNDERQFSLWPATIAVPDGWFVAHTEDCQQVCLDYIETTWTDMRPASLVAAMANDR